MALLRGGEKRKRREVARMKPEMAKGDKSGIMIREAFMVCMKQLVAVIESSTSKMGEWAGVQHQLACSQKRTACDLKEILE